MKTRPTPGVPQDPKTVTLTEDEKENNEPALVDGEENELGTTKLQSQAQKLSKKPPKALETSPSHLCCLSVTHVPTGRALQIIMLIAMARIYIVFGRHITKSPTEISYKHTRELTKIKIQQVLLGC